MEFTGTRKPPSRPSRQEEVVETVRVEITDAVTTIGIDLYNIARAYDDVFPRSLSENGLGEMYGLA